MGDRRVQFSQNGLLGSSSNNLEVKTPSSLAISPSTSPPPPLSSSSFEANSSVAKTIDQRRHVSPPVSPSKRRINIVFVADLELESVTLRHRRAILECVKMVSREMEANLVMVQYEELNSNVSSALDSFYDADAAIIDISIEEQRNSLFYHLGVRESFSMKQNILLVADILDSSPRINDSDTEDEDEHGDHTNTTKKSSREKVQLLTHDSAAQIKNLLPNYALFVYSIEPKSDPAMVNSQLSRDCQASTGDADGTGYECFVDQSFIDLTYSPSSDEQIDPSIPDIDSSTLEEFARVTSNSSCPVSTEQNNLRQQNLANTNTAYEDTSLKQTVSTRDSSNHDKSMSLSLKGQLKEALKNVKWQAKAHMKEKFLADLKKARESYQGEELYKILHTFRRRLDDPNMLSIEVVYQMLVSFREVQDYDSMVQLVDDLSKFPSLHRIISSPQIVFYHAFALNRRHNAGDSDRALELITAALETRENQIPDSICLCGRIFKDRFIESDYADQASLKSAIDWYRKSFKISPNEYAAINLATLLYIAGQDFASSSELKHVGLVLNNLIGKKGPVHKLENYWDVATYFEFCLLANQFAKAIEAASCMFVLKPNKWHLKSTIGNIKLIYRFKPKWTPSPADNGGGGGGSSSKSNIGTTSSTGGGGVSSTCQQEILQSPEEQIVDFWMDFFIDAVSDSCDKQIRFAALVFEQNNEYMPTYITMNLDAEERSITISQMCISHLRDLNACRKPHLWHIKATGVRGISLYKRDERCVFLYVHNNSDDFQIFFPSEAIRARFHSLVLSITGDRSIDISANLNNPEKRINFVYELDKADNRIVLGRGSKGVVYAARNVDTQTQIAIKEVPVKNPGEVQPLHEEIRLHSMLSHRNIVQYLGTSHEGNYFRIIMERVPGGSLSQLLQREWGPLNENVIAYYSRQILDGLQYLHRQQIVHRDIKGDNVLVNTYTGTLKISDFGTCKRLAAINPNTETFAGTVPFMAPELLDRGQRGYSMPADIWSFGCTVVEMASGKPPFIEIVSKAQVMFRVGYYKEHPEIPSELTNKCKEFILRCFEPNSENRATCDELLQDPFLDEARPSSSASVLQQRRPNRSSAPTLRLANSAISGQVYTVDPSLIGTPSSLLSSGPIGRHRQHYQPKTSWTSTSSSSLTTVGIADERLQHYGKKDEVHGGKIVELKEEVDDELDYQDGDNEDDLVHSEDEDDYELSDADDITLTAAALSSPLSAGTPNEVRLSAPSFPSSASTIVDEKCSPHKTGERSTTNVGTSAAPSQIEFISNDSATNAAPEAHAAAAAAAAANPLSQNHHHHNHHQRRQQPIMIDRAEPSTKRLIELVRRLSHKNRLLWSKLYEVQLDLHKSLTMQLNDKQSQIEALNKQSNQMGPATATTPKRANNDANDEGDNDDEKRER